MDFSTLSPELQTIFAPILQDKKSPLPVEGVNPVLSTARRLGDALEEGQLSLADVTALVQTLRDSAFLRRASRLHRYVGGAETATTARRLAAVTHRVIAALPEPTPEAFQAAVSPVRFAAVFTAHPTFAVSNPVYATLAESASEEVLPESVPFFETHRRDEPPTLEEEFTLATLAISRARDAMDQLNGALLETAREHWPDAWTSVIPRPVIATSWVGYDTDGRTDIGWWDTLRLRLRMKLFQLERLAQQISTTQASAPALMDRLHQAIACVEAQINATPTGPDAEAVARFADVLVNSHQTALLNAGDLADDLDAAIQAAEPADRLPLAIARAGFMAHGLALAHTHVRLNATQIHNFVRQKLDIPDDPANPSHRRAVLNRLNDALDTVQAVPVDFGALMSDPSTAGRLMMTVAQISKHIDNETSVRFLIAETETGYTLLAALWAALHFGVADKVEISPLFETEEALSNGDRIVEEALRSPTWRAYVQRTGRISFQFGYSDSGRYVGQLAATYLIERLRLKIHDLLVRWNLQDVTVIFFDTHGESIGRGAHPFRMAGRLSYLSPRHVRAEFARTGIACREETAFQGGDGYVLFGTPQLAGATLATIAENLFNPLHQEGDPVYEQPVFSADFFSSISEGMQALVEDPGYAALLGAFGPALIDRTGSRPPARQSAEAATSTRLTHPSQLRAIPNNAILQQLGWCANTLQGLGAAVRRHPETFEIFNTSSPRFHRALDFARHALSCSDDRVLQSVINLLDPGYWLDRATAEGKASRRAAFLTLMHDLEKLNLSADLRTLFRRIQADHLALREAWEDAPHGAPLNRALHAIRIALIERIWILACRIPFFMPRGGFNRDMMMQQILRLEIPAVLKEMVHIFPSGTVASNLDFHEPRGPREQGIYEREHREIFMPMQQMFALLREISVGVMHDIGAFG
ncbi:phosphoenolpyruvate carboxylase [Acetobacter persici]|uniref:phosphoenolpyruvate carboxylase n=1 Tax=Acetobacter persici TaxID=1076596 RepID=UPI001BADD50E|nr:phosphoenolpyruvate carboxylase [Acetobacter persici]MBS0963224.1 phosphoenolpyruvate carboxylase [Acetobacter persici]